MAVSLPKFRVEAPDGVVIGIVGTDGAGKGALLRQALETGRGALIGPNDPLVFDPTPLLCLEHALARHDAIVRERAAIELDRLRRAGTTVLLVSHEEDLLRRLADEIWWIRDGKLAGRGDPGEMLAAYRKHVAAEVRAWGQSVRAPLSPRMRRGDGRAEVVSVETIGENGCPTMVWRSGELAVVRATIRFRDAVDDPVVGMMIRTRIGLNVYGTNTELERLKLGPRQAGDTIQVAFAFRCELCPEEYTLTIASHDPDGVWHDWLEDAVAFAVADDRYTAGVANLRATVSFEVV
jgi:lipopolysaccharide transport system ATP-binding protein